MDDYHFGNIEKKLKNHVKGKKTCNSTKIGHILCIENKIVKDLINAFLTLNLQKKKGQFKQNKICRFLHDI
jgi:hypothetical protein